jgi:large subunit ribosomal protein L28
LYSKILNKEIRVNITKHTVFLIKYYGSFDNYILCCPSKEMVSMFGEYLRKMMLIKINEPNLDFKNAQLFGTEKDVFKRSRKKNKVDIKEGIHEEYKYKDLSVNFLRPLNKLTRREIKALRDIIENRDDLEGV